MDVRWMCLLGSLLALTAAAPLDQQTPLLRVKRSKEQMLFGNHQNKPKVMKKADPLMTPSLEDIKQQQAEKQEDAEGAKKAAEEQEAWEKHVDRLLSQDIEQEQKEQEQKETQDQEEQASKTAIEKMFAPIAEDMTEDEEAAAAQAEGEQAEEGSGEEAFGEFTDKTMAQPEGAEEYYYPDYESYYYEPLPSRRKRSGAPEKAGAAYTAEEMMDKPAHNFRSKRDLTDDEISTLLNGGGYTGDEYYNFPVNREEEEQMAEQQRVNDLLKEMEAEGPAEYRQYIEDLMDRALQEADVEEKLIQEQQEEEAEEEAAEAYQAALEREEEALEEQEELAKEEAAQQQAVGLLRMLIETVPDDGSEPVRGQREEVGPGYRVEQSWEQYVPNGASVEQEELLADFQPIVYNGQKGLFIPLEKKAADWGMSALPGLRKRGSVDMMEAKREYDAYDRLYRLARALRGEY